MYKAAGRERNKWLWSAPVALFFSAMGWAKQTDPEVDAFYLRVGRPKWSEQS
jgi:hypothetical protein